MKRLPMGLLIAMVLALGALADIPPPDGYVNDLVGALSPESKTKLTEMTQALKADKDVELGILIIETTGGQDIAQYTTEVARAWGIGSKQGEHRGMLFVLATKDRKNFLTASRHLEGDFPDLVCADLCKAGRGQFAKGAWGAGVELVVNKISERVNAVLSKDQVETPAGVEETSSLSPMVFGLLLLGVGTGIAAVVMRYRRKKREAEEAEEERLARARRLRELTSKAEPRKSPSKLEGRFPPPPPYQPHSYSEPAPKKDEPERKTRSSYSPPEPSKSSYSPPEPSRRDDSSSWGGSSSWGSSGGSDSGGGSFGGGGDFGGGGGGDSF